MLVFAAVASQWDDILGAVQVKTPDRSMDIMLNRWLLYQTLACRVWARSAFYQASGAYGFRDQLQDVMALTVSKPTIARDHILRAAARQFVAGDVQHWWLPPSGQGVRTRVADDRVWLPFTAAHYVEVTNDLGVLDETIPFLDGPVLQPGEDESYFLPDGLRRALLAVRTLRARSRFKSFGRQPRPAANRLWRLERWHEPSRPSGPRREHLARLVPSYHALVFRASWRMIAGSIPVPRHGGIMRPSCGNL